VDPLARGKGNDKLDLLELSEAPLLDVVLEAGKKMKLFHKAPPTSVQLLCQ